MENRNQSVLHNGICSDEKGLTTGVPQGSTLGPLLFLLYINDLPDVVSNSESLMFADDTVLYHSNVLPEMLYQNLQRDLDAVNVWCAINYITLNISKSQYVCFGYRRANVENYVLKLGETTLDKVDSYKYLGTMIDNKLNGEAQYSKLMQTLAGKKITFSKIRYLMNTETAVLLFESTIQPIFYL